MWVFASSSEPTFEPFRFPHLQTPGYSTVRRVFQVKAAMHSVIENTLDVPHTAFLHSGLFRTPRKEHVLEVTVRRHGTRAEAQFSPEPRPAGLVGWLLAPRGGLVQHVDRFLLPGIAQVEYQLGDSHFIATTQHTPISPFETRLFAAVTFKLPVPHFLVKPFVTPVATRIFKQDAQLLELQTLRLQQLGLKYTSSELDVLGPQILMLLRQSARGELNSAAPVHEHVVKMQL